MMFRNVVLRIASLAVSGLFILYVKYLSAEPDAVSVNIMLTTLLFSVLRSGFSFDRLSKSQSNTKTSSCFSIDKLILLFLVLIYSQYVGVKIHNVVYALLAASIITLIYFKQYPGYTMGGLLPSVLISLVFPVQVVINLSLNYFHPEMLLVILAVLLMLYMSYDRYFARSERMGRTEIYYSMLLPVGGFSAVSIDGIDKPLYMLVSKIIDSVGSVAGFVIQGNLKRSKLFMERHDVIWIITLITVALFVVGCVLYMTKPVDQYMVIAASIYINMCLFMYSMFTLVFFIKHGEAALKNIYNQIKCFGILLPVLYLMGGFELKYIVIALSISLIYSMLMSRFTAPVQ